MVQGFAGGVTFSKTPGAQGCCLAYGGVGQRRLQQLVGPQIKSRGATPSSLACRTCLSLGAGPPWLKGFDLPSHLSPALPPPRALSLLPAKRWWSAWTRHLWF